MGSSLDYRVKNVENLSLSKRQDNSVSGAKPGENIMPVELAIKRELAYQRRIMMLRSQTSVGSRDAPISSKGLSPSQNLVGIKRKEPSCNFLGMKSKLVLNLNRYPRVDGYKKMLKGFEENQEYIGQKGDNQLWCNACNIPCTSEYCLAQHFMGKKHAECIETTKMHREKERKLPWSS
ncbi:hypothetical protein NE237_020215 [Protea cynaroides]|uniref:C2H2-type domain-containing protein n=1 Tax=Protea cynaroides TaxID=273540 RepID=A0A9Q0K382_9MAGN|nr:hypothetical protein NE237_020215 [Protea cynaroides]